MSQQQQQLNYEKYQRIKLLGEGAFGKAYLVQCQSNAQFCVMKQVNFAKMSSKEQKETCKEARILEVLSHPNIIRFKEVYTTKKGKLCILMDYADGDFGIARILGSTLDKARTQIGTPYYLSPEIVENRPYSFKSDIWSLGVILYELCALHPPFNSDNLPGLALKIASGNFQPIPSIYSRELKKLVDFLLLTDARRRPYTSDILKMPFIQKRIQNFLSEADQKDEFSHTVLHQKNVLQKNRQLLPMMREDESGKPVQSNNNGNYLNVNNILQQHYNNNKQYQQQQINPIPQQIPIQKPVRDEQQKKRQQQSLEKQNEVYKYVPNNENINCNNNNHENNNNNNNNNKFKYKKNFRKEISTPKNQKPINQNFFPIQTPSCLNQQPQFQRNSTKNEREQKINFPVNNNKKEEKKKILFPPSFPYQKEYSSNQDRQQQQYQQQQKEQNQKINEKNKKLEELKKNKDNSPETKWKIIREEKEIERQIERNKMKIDIQERRKIKRDIPVQIFMPKFKELSKKNSVDGRNVITPERQILEFKRQESAADITPERQYYQQQQIRQRQKIPSVQQIETNLNKQSLEKLPTPKQSEKIIDQYIWKNNQNDDQNNDNDISKMYKELEDIILKEAEENNNNDSIIQEDLNEEINLSFEEKDLKNMQLKNLEIEDQLNIEEIQNIQLNLNDNFSFQQQHQIIDQLKQTLGEILGQDKFLKAYTIMKNQLKNEKEKNKWILSYNEEKFYNLIPFLKKLEFQQNYGLFATLLFMEEETI